MKLQKASIQNVYDVYRTMCDNDLSIIYEGYFDQEITKGVLSLVERNFSENGMDELTKKRIFNIMVEVLQNICKHQDNSSGEPAIFIVGKDQEDFTIISGNSLEPENSPKLVKMLEDINGKDKDELKQMYKEAKLNSVISEVGGAGLGFIDIARKSGNKLGYCIRHNEGAASFFIFKSIIANQKSE